MASNANPRWPAEARGRRVLLECDDPELQDGLHRVLSEDGYAVALCAGPGSRHSGVCPLVIDGHCGLVEEAHVIVHALDAADPAHRDVLSAVVKACPGTPVVVEARTARAHEIDPTSGEVRLVEFALDRNALMSAVERAASSGEESQSGS